MGQQRKGAEAGAGNLGQRRGRASDGCTIEVTMRRGKKNKVGFFCEESISLVTLVSQR